MEDDFPGANAGQIGAEHRDSMEETPESPATLVGVGSSVGEIVRCGKGESGGDMEGDSGNGYEMQALGEGGQGDVVLNDASLVNHAELQAAETSNAVAIEVQLSVQDEENNALPPVVVPPPPPTTRPQRSRRRRHFSNPRITVARTTPRRHHYSISRRTFNIFLHFFYVIWYTPTLILNPIALLLFSDTVCDSRLRIFLLVTTCAAFIDCPRLPLKFIASLQPTRWPFSAQRRQRDRASRAIATQTTPTHVVAPLPRPSQTLPPAAEPQTLQQDRGFLTSQLAQDVQIPILDSTPPPPPLYRTTAKSIIRYLTPLWALLWLFNPVWCVVGAVWVFRASPCSTLTPVIFYLTFTIVLTQITLLIAWSIIGYLHVRADVPPPQLTDDLIGDDFWAPVDPETMRPVGVGVSDEEWEMIVAEKYRCGDEGMCSICLCEYEEGVELRRLGCGHRFHEGCAWRWLRDEGRGGVGRTTCPLCVKPVSGNGA
ncbi:hypothetical protein BC829DRAFT_444987 [Chytridium lagenaria]|nr:hypothetical protein BC829DRAFT_444987 [Chytridium lagenaria]